MNVQGHAYNVLLAVHGSEGDTNVINIKLLSFFHFCPNLSCPVSN